MFTNKTSLDFLISLSLFILFRLETTRLRQWVFGIGAIVFILMALVGIFRQEVKGE